MNRRSSLAALALACLTLAGLLLVGCFDPERVPNGPPRGYETDVFSCEDGRDNDLDGLVDCQDPDCIGRNFCGEIVPDLPTRGVENTVRLCTDRIDNDEDGQFDCGDRDCQAILELCCVTEISNVTCSDGIDNDGNGFADCMDFACRQNSLVDVCRREDDCSDGEDNDGDRRTDCGDSDCDADPACGVESGDEDTVERCMDGVDNDDNGFTDCEDFSCCGNRGCTEPIDPIVGEYCASLPQEDTTESCTDGIDNDENGFTDCAEFGCCREGRCIDVEVQKYCDTRPTEDDCQTCLNGIDDDDDGFTDCEDRSCSESELTCDGIRLRDRCESSYASCTNGIDDEGDGFTDCSDFSCRVVQEELDLNGDGRTELVYPCFEGVLPGTVENPLRALAEAIEQCSNGIDEDADGFTDCADWDCHWNPLLNPRATEASPVSSDGVPQQGFCQGFINPTGGEWVPQDPARYAPGVPVPLLCQ